MKTRRLVLSRFTMLLLINTVALSQSTRTGTTIALLTPQASLIRIGTDGLASGGASVAEKGLAAAAFTNPAGMRFAGLTVYAEFGKYSTSAWPVGLDYNGQFLVPAVLSIGLPMDGVFLSLGYFRQYSNRVASGPIPVTTPEFPDGTGEVVTFERRVEMQSLCGSVRVALNEDIALGLTVGGNYFTHRDDMWRISFRGTDNGLLLVGGVTVVLNEDITLGTSARFNQPLEYVLESTSPGINLGPIDTSRIRVTALQNPPVEARFPPTLEMGAACQAAPWLRLLASVEFQNWTTALSYAENRWQVHIGGVADVHDHLTLRFGFFTLSSPSVYNREILDQKFITLGLQVKASPFVLSFAVMDSHLFSKPLPSAGDWPYSDQFYQTYVSSGLSLTL